MDKIKIREQWSKQYSVVQRQGTFYIYAQVLEKPSMGHSLLVHPGSRQVQDRPVSELCLESRSGLQRSNTGTWENSFPVSLEKLSLSGVCVAYRPTRPWATVEVSQRLEICISELLLTGPMIWYQEASDDWIWFLISEGDHAPELSAFHKFPSMWRRVTITALRSFPS